MKKEKVVLMQNNQQGIKHTIETIFLILQRGGIYVTVQKICKNIYYKLRGIDFSMQSLSELDIQNPHKNHATICGSSSQETMENILDIITNLHPNIKNGAFVDIGSGKGRLLYTAYKFGFQRYIGVEFSQQLVNISKDNFKKLNIFDIDIVHMDATLFIPPKDTRVLYLLNPFDDVVMKKFLKHILKYHQNYEHDIYLIYRAPVFKDVFKEFKILKHLKTIDFNGDKSEIYLLNKQRQNSE